MDWTPSSDPTVNHVMTINIGPTVLAAEYDLEFQIKSDDGLYEDKEAF